MGSARPCRAFTACLEIVNPGDIFPDQQLTAFLPEVRFHRLWVRPTMSGSGIGLPAWRNTSLP